MSTLELSLERGLPASIDAERSILGAIQRDNSLLDQVAGLPEDAFSLDSHRRIFRAAMALLREGASVDIVTIMDRLRERKEVDAIGGVSYLASLTEGLPLRPSIDDYVRIVREKWELRRVIRVCSDAITKAMDQGEESPHELITAADKDLLAITADNQSAWPAIEQQSLTEFDRLERQRTGKEAPAYDYGILTLDRLVAGLVPREMTVLGGRPGQGKTGLTAQMIVRHCRRGVAIHAFELEMTSGQLLRRLWAIVAGVPFHKLRHPERQSQEEHDRVVTAMGEVGQWPLVIDDASSLGIEQMVSRARIGKRRQGTRIVIVDYLQKMRFSPKPQYRYLEVTEAAVQLARFAKEEDLAVLLLSSLSEKSGSSRNLPPTLQDFRQSGDIAYEAHCALLVHREIDDETERPKEHGELIIGKARSDEPGCVRVRFNPEFLSFEDAPFQGRKS